MSDWLNPLVQQMGLTLIHFIWQGALLGLLFGIGLLALKSAGANARYGLAVGTLAVLAVLPIATFFYLGASPAVEIGAAVPAGGADFIMLMAQQGINSAAGPGLLGWVVAGWLAGVAVMSIRLLIGWRYLARLRRSADFLAGAHLQPALARLKARIGVSRQVALAVSSRVQSPVVVGWLKPLILFPPAVVNFLPMDQIEMVLAHELAHIRRHDHLVNLFQTTIETVLFYHPVVAWVSRQIRVERENACDDLAVASTGHRLAYVEMLATLEQMRFRGPRLVMAMAMHDGQILGRIRRLVEQTRPDRQRGLMLPSILVITILGAGLALFLPEDKQQNDQYSDQPAAIETAYAAQQQTQPSPPTEVVTAAHGAIAEPGAAQPREAEPVPEPTADRDELQGAAPTASSRPTSAPATANISTPPPVEQSPSPRADQQSITGSHGVQTAADQPSEPEPAVTQPAAEPVQLAALPREPARPGLIDQERQVNDALVNIEPPAINGGQLIRQVEPDFPSRAHRRGTSGLVELELTVDRNGQVRDIEIVREQPETWDFGQSARNAVGQWQFEPFRRGDQRVEHVVRIEVAFEPDEAFCKARTGTRVPRC